MSVATIFLGVSFVIELFLSLYYFWTMNEMPQTNPKTNQGKFQTLGIMAAGINKSFLTFFIQLMLFFIFYGALMATMTDVINIYDSDNAIKNTIKTEDWRLGWEFLKIMIAIMYINFGVLCWRIINQTRILTLVLGSKTKKELKWNIK